MGADAPAVTVVMPTHDRPRLMARAVQSVLDQAYDGPVEVLVVFDACEPVLPDLDVPAGRSLRGLANGRTRGLAGARNTGILAAGGELVAFLDDDDRWLPAKLARQVAVLAANPEAVLAGTAMVADDGRRTWVRQLPASVVTHRALLHHRLPALHSSSLLIRREALLGGLGLVDEAIPRSYGEDYDLLLRASAIAPVPVVNQPLVRVTWQVGSHFVGRWDDFADAWQYLLAKHPDFATSRRALARMEAQVAFALAAAGRRGEGTRWARRSLRHDPRQPRAWLALVLGRGPVTPARIATAAHHLGRGI